MTEPTGESTSIASEESPSVGKLLDKLSEEQKAKIQQRATILESEYMKEHGTNVAGPLNGNPTDATKAHSFLFDKATKEEDPEIREEIHLAHLSLELKYNNQDRARTSRQKSLQEDPRINFWQGGMLKSGQELVKGSQGERLRINTEELLDAFSKFDDLYAQYYQMYTTEKAKQVPEGLTARQIAVILAAQQTATDYFGDPNDHAEMQNAQMYAKAEGRTLSLEDFKGTTNAVCTEYAALTQHLMAFAGERSDFISGIITFCDQQSIIEGSPTGAPLVHAFNLFYTSPDVNDGKVFVFDPSNPVIETDSLDPTVQIRRLYLAPLASEQWETFRRDTANTYLQYRGTHRFYSLT